MTSNGWRGAVFWLALAASLPALAFGPGDRVLVEWEKGLWYPARVLEATEGVYRIAYDNGEFNLVVIESVRKLDWRAGSVVQCNFRNQGKYFPGRIDRIDGESIVIAYDDGDREQATISLCRAR